MSFIIVNSQITNDDYKKMIDSAISLKNENSTVSKHYILNSENQPYTLSDDLKSKGLETINIYDKKNRKIITNGINVWKIISILNSNIFEIRIIDFTVKQHKDNYQFSNGGGSTFIYEYSCENKIWKLISTKHSGI